MFWLRPLIFLVATIAGWFVGSEIFSWLNSSTSPQNRKVSPKFRNKLVLGIYGRVATGKGTAFQHLTGKEVSDISPIPGSTKTVSTVQWGDILTLADVPGHDDIDEDTGKLARDFINNVDLFIYMINANGGYQETDKKFLHILLNTERAVLVVVNKMDTIEKEGKRVDAFKADLLGKIPEKVDALCFTSFRPNGSDMPVGTQCVADWIKMQVDEWGDEYLKKKRAKL